MQRLAVLVLDAAERSFLLELADGGDLPTIARMLDEGAFAPLHTSVAYRSEYASTELLTGRTSAETRYWSTVVFDPATYACTTIGSARRQPFYAVAPAGRAIVFDVPHSILVDGLDGAQVVGWGGHDSRFQHPRQSSPTELMDEIDRRFGVDPVNAVEYSGGWHQEWYIDALADAAVASARRRVDIAVWLQRRVPDWQLLLMGMSELHSAGHNMAHGMDPNHLLGAHRTAALARQRLIDVYRAVDDATRAIEAAVPAGTSMALVATKGMQANRDDVGALLLVPELLHRLSSGRPFVHEPAQRRWVRAGRPAVSPDPRYAAGRHSGQLRAQGALPRVKRRFHTMAPDAVVSAVYRARRPFLPQPTAVEPRQWTPDGDTPVLAGTVSWSPPMWYRSQWPRMRWFALPSFSDAHVRINLRGRERDGIVELDDYERECDALEGELRKATDPRTGEPIVGDVIRLRADDPLAPDGPGADLAVTFRAPVDALAHPTCGIVGPFAFTRSGSHTENGFLLVRGEGIPATTLDLRPAVDAPVTLLQLLGWPVPSILSGTVLTEVVGALAD